MTVSCNFRNEKMQKTVLTFFPEGNAYHLVIPLIVMHTSKIMLHVMAKTLPIVQHIVLITIFQNRGKTYCSISDVVSVGGVVHEEREFAKFSMKAFARNVDFWFIFTLFF